MQFSNISLQYSEIWANIKCDKNKQQTFLNISQWAIRNVLNSYVKHTLNNVNLAQTTQMKIKQIHPKRMHWMLPTHALHYRHD